MTEQTQGSIPNSAKAANTLPLKHISVAVEKAEKYISAKQSGLLPSIKTGFSKLDELLLDGIE